MILLKFSASWCSPCAQLTKLMQDVDLTGIELINVDADTDANTAKQYNVRAIPTLILLDSTGEEIKRKSGGFTVSELNKFLSVWR